jgi:hypothetical protein
MGVTQGRHVLIFNSELGQLVNNSCEFWQEEVKALANKKQICVVGNIG